MSEFYEQMLYLSTPDHPNTMGVLAVLKEAVDGELLRDVVEVLRARFPWRRFLRSSHQSASTVR